MKKYFLMLALAVLSLISVNAQDFDTDPVLKVDNKENDVHFTIGARMMSDVAWYHTDYTPLQSGASITDARIRASMSYQDWYFYADFGFGNGEFSQKNIFLQYALDDKYGNNHAIKAGYYNEPSGSMSRNTSLGSYHFISRAGSANALGEGRALGITYKFTNDKFTAYQGVFTENQYNKIDAGFNGITLSGRWIYRPIKDDNQTLHVGANVRWAHLGGGEEYSGTIKKTLSLSQSLETYVDDDTQFLSCDLDWANNVFDLGAEVLYHNAKFFARGEYFYKYVTKKRDLDAVFQGSGYAALLGSATYYGMYFPIRNNTFHGGYIEAGYLIFGNPYKYSLGDAVLGGLNGKSLEIVARVNYTGLNDIEDGDYFSAATGTYYTNGYIQDFTISSTSVGGGNVWSYTVGANYSFNKYAQVMLNYTYHHLDNDYYPIDKNFHQIQGRIMFTF